MIITADLLVQKERGIERERERILQRKIGK
jgi:hypothetical protein